MVRDARRGRVVPQFALVVFGIACADDGQEYGVAQCHVLPHGFGEDFHAVLGERGLWGVESVEPFVERSGECCRGRGFLDVDGCHDVSPCVFRSLNFFFWTVWSSGSVSRRSVREHAGRQSGLRGAGVEAVTIMRL